MISVAFQMMVATLVEMTMNNLEDNDDDDNVLFAFTEAEDNGRLMETVYLLIMRGPRRHHGDDECCPP